MLSPNKSTIWINDWVIRLSESIGRDAISIPFEKWFTYAFKSEIILSFSMEKNFYPYYGDLIKF